MTCTNHRERESETAIRFLLSLLLSGVVRSKVLDKGVCASGKGDQVRGTSSQGRAASPTQPCTTPDSLGQTLIHTTFHQSHPTILSPPFLVLILYQDGLCAVTRWLVARFRWGRR